MYMHLSIFTYLELHVNKTTHVVFWDVHVICSVYLDFCSRLLGLIKIIKYSSNLWVFLLFILA